MILRQRLTLSDGMGCAFSASCLVIQMPDLMVTRGNLDEAMALIQDEIERNHVALVSVSSGTTGKWGMSRLWRSWMNSVAKWMASQGVTMPLAVKASGELYGARPFNADDAHELFSMQLQTSIAATCEPFPIYQSTLS